MFVFWLLVLVIALLVLYILSLRHDRYWAERNRRFWRIAFQTAVEERDEARTLVAQVDPAAAQAMSERWYERDRIERRGKAEERYIENGEGWPR